VSNYHFALLHDEEKSLAGNLQLYAIHFFNRKWEAFLDPQGLAPPEKLIDVLTSIRYPHNRT
jgi:hypothetical protein